MGELQMAAGRANPPYSWIVGFWSWIFHYLKFVSIAEPLWRLRPSWRKHSFVDIYVSLNTLAALVALIVVTWRRDYDPTLLLKLVTVYGALRTFEVFVYQVNVLLFDQYRHNRDRDPEKIPPFEVRGYRRLVILLVHNYFEIVCWFGVLYMYLYRSNVISLPRGSEANFFRVFRESMLLMFSFAPEQYTSNSKMGMFFFSLQATIGVFMSVLVLARFVAVLPPPKTMDPFEEPDA